jgi:MFS family permease/tetratricopeptide (TPR) repeat protein
LPLDVRGNDGSRKFAQQEVWRLRRSFQELAELLGPPPRPPSEDSPHRDNPPNQNSDWAAARTQIGLAYAQRAGGDQSQNWELAIAAFNDALSVWTRESNPEDWAAACASLGVAYRERSTGDRSDNQERAVRAFEDSLSVWTREHNPEEWAAARMNFGIAYWERLAGDRSENREHAIRAFEDSLSVWTRDSNPEDWATAHLNLGFAYWERDDGERAANRERSIAAFENGLSVVACGRDPGKWATARLTLGVAYWGRFTGDRSENQDRAIVAFDDALSVWTREDDPRRWAVARMNLGIAYWERLAGDPSQNRERAIDALEDALSVRTREANPEMWADARTKLGIAYLERTIGERAENVERAIAGFKDALSVWTREANPEGWAAAQANLGLAYRQRHPGDRPENRERAIRAFENALSVGIRDRGPDQGAVARANLEAAYRERFDQWLENRVTIGPVAPQDVKVIALVSSAHFMSHFYQLVLPPLFPLLKGALGVGYAELSIVMTLMYATSGLMQTPAGLIVDRLGSARVLIGGLGLYSVAVLAYGFAPNLWVLAGLAVVAGLGNSVFHPADYAILSARVGATRLGRAYGLHNFGGSLGWAAAPIAVLTLTSVVGWRVGLSILGGLGLLLTAYLIVQAAVLTTENRIRSAGETVPSKAQMFLSRTILVCFGYFALLAMATVALQAFLPSSLVSGFGISFELASSALTGFLIGSALGMFVGGIIADWFGRHELVVATGLLTTAVGCLVIGVLTLPITVLILVIAVGGFAWGCTTPSRDMLVRTAAPAGAMGTVVGFVYSGLDFGSALTPPFLGFLLDHQRPRLIFVFTAGILFLAISSALVIGQKNAVGQAIGWRLKHT